MNIPTSSNEETAELERMEAQMKALRLEARELARSGNPATKAEGERAVAQCDQDLRWIRLQLSKEDRV